MHWLQQWSKTKLDPVGNQTSMKNTKRHKVFISEALNAESTQHILQERMHGQQFRSLFLPIWLTAKSEKHSAWCKEQAGNIQQEERERETVARAVLISSH